MPRVKHAVAKRQTSKMAANPPPEEADECSTDSSSNICGPNNNPCRTQTGFKLFFTEFVQGLKQSASADDIRGKMASVIQLAGQMWRELSADEKAYYTTRACQERQIHRESQPARKKRTSKRSTFRTKCSPRMVVKLKDEIMNQPHKVQLIRLMGFESMLGLSCKTLRLSFIVYILDRFDPDSRLLQVDGTDPVHITSKHVGKVLGIPYAGKRVPDVIASNKMDLLKDRFSNRSLHELHRLTVEDEESDEVFMQTYLLYLLGGFLCPTTKDEASLNLFPAISIASKANEYNWGSFVLKWLVNQVKSYKKKLSQGAKANGTGGCLFFLMIFTLRQAGFDNVGGDGGHGFMVGWTDDLVEQCIKRVMPSVPNLHGSRDGPSSFGGSKRETSHSSQHFRDPMLDSIYQQLRVFDQHMQHSGAGPSSSRLQPSFDFQDTGGRARQDAQPRTVVALWKANIEEPKFHQSDPALIIFEKSTKTRCKFASANDGDKQQLQCLYDACRGIPQAVPPLVLHDAQTSVPATAAQTAVEAAELAMAINASIQSAMEDRPPLHLSNHPSSEANDVNGWGNTTNDTSHNEWGSFGGPPPSEASSSRWMVEPAKEEYNGGTRQNGWGSFDEPPPSEASSSGWMDEPTKEEYNGWGVPESRPTSNPIRVIQMKDILSPVVQTSNANHALVSSAPSAPPVPEEVLDEGPIHYPSIDFSPVDMSIPPVENEASFITSETKDEGGSSTCVICWEAPIEGACIPCGHMAGCMSCLNEIKTKKGDCPVCRAKIDQVIRVYAV